MPKVVQILEVVPEDCPGGLPRRFRFALKRLRLPRRIRVAPGGLPPAGLTIVPNLIYILTSSQVLFKRSKRIDVVTV